jgi:predicted  nucleic acid-binding Zn-ribbon protein
MEKIKNLYDLQKIDSKIDDLRSIFIEVNAKLANRSELINSKMKIKVVKENLTDSESKLRRTQNKLADIEQRINELDKRLYDGELRNSKEVILTQNEQMTLAEQKNDFEDLSLQLMEDIEKHAVNYKNNEEQISMLMKDRVKLENSLKSEAENLKKQMVTLVGSREIVAKTIPKTLLPLYEALRESKNGKAVVVVRGGVCNGCRIALSSSNTQRLSESDELNRCGSCQRILYVM